MNMKIHSRREVDGWSQNTIPSKFKPLFKHHVVFSILFTGHVRGE